MYNKKVLSEATKNLNSTKAPAKKKDKIVSKPVVSTQGYKQGPPPTGSHYRIPGDGAGTSIYNPTPYPLNLIGPNGTQAQIGPWDTNTQHFDEPYMDEFPMVAYGGDISIPDLNQYEDGGEYDLTDDEIEQLKKGGYIVEHLPSLPKKKGSKAYSRSLTATNKLFAQNPLLKKPKSKKNKIFDPQAKQFEKGGFQDDLGKHRQLLRDWTYGQSIGMLQKAQIGLIKSPYQLPAGTMHPMQMPAKKVIKQPTRTYDPLIDNKPQKSETTQKTAAYSKNVAEDQQRAAELRERAAKMMAEKDAQKTGVDYNTALESANKAVQSSDFNSGEYIQREDVKNIGAGPASETVVNESTAPQSYASRAWDMVTNPQVAFEYAVRTGDFRNMPHNYNDMLMAGIDPSAGGGSNLVGNTLNTSTNLFDAGDKVVRNIGEGNYGTAALEALRFLPGARMTTGLGRKVGTYLKSTAPEYAAGFSKLKPGLNTLKQNSVFLNKKLVEAAGKLPDNVVNRRLEEFTKVRRDTGKPQIGSIKELETALKTDVYRVNKLKKQYPELDFNDPNIEGFMFTDKARIERVPELLKGIQQNRKSGESFGNYLIKDYNTKMDFIRNSGNKTLINVIDESPQYLDEVYDQLKNPTGTDADFLNDLTVKSNTYTRFMNKDYSNDLEYLKELKGKNIENSGYSMDVEGVYPSNYYGAYGYKIQPSAQRVKEITNAPLEQKWSLRQPTFQSDIKMVPGMHTGFPKQVDDYLKIREQRLDRMMPGEQQYMNWRKDVPMEVAPLRTLEKNLPDSYLESKSYRIPQHQVFNSKQYGTKIENFDVVPLGQLNTPETRMGYKTYDDYGRFFEGTGKGFKKGGLYKAEYGIEMKLTPEEIQAYRDGGYIVDELD
jgi:hypothetical protein